MKLERMYSKGRINHVVKGLADRISADYRDARPLLICVLNGAFIFAADLIREIDIHVDIDFIRVSSYRDGHFPSELVLSVEPQQPLIGRDIILIEDIVDTGWTASWILAWCSNFSPRSLKLCALLNKTAKRRVFVRIDYCGFDNIPNKFVVGYGMDDAGSYRGMQAIYKYKVNEEG